MTASLKVLYEDNHLIAVYKQAGVLVQGDRSGDVSLLELTKIYLKEKYKKSGNVFLGLIHRLDRNVSGIVLFAKTSKGASRLSEQFREHTVEKMYHAWVEGIVERQMGKLVHSLIHHEKSNKVDVTERGYTPATDTDYAELSYEVITRQAHCTLLKIRLVTGRHHQIRAQLSHIGHPILGDVKYGASKSFPDGHLALYATELHFYPATVAATDVSGRITISIPVPQESC